MSFKDDFLEALKSVKRDILGDGAPEQEDDSFVKSFDSELLSADAVSQREEEVSQLFPNEAVTPPPASSSEVADEPNAERFSADKPRGTYAREDFEPIETPPPPFPPVPPASFTGEYNDRDARQIFDFESSELYNDDKTVISKNTVIRGSLQTQDSIRLLGQVLGDIECRSNIVIAGKMRGNTLAANAYVMGAQIDGDMICEDNISINNDAWILGNIRAQQAEVDGKIKGNLEIRHGISIGASSSIIGNISADELEIKRGAFVNGQIIMYSPSRDVIDRFDHFEGAQ